MSSSRCSTCPGLTCWVLLSIAVTGCRPPAPDSRPAGERESPSAIAQLATELAGTWRGTSYADELGLFHARPPLAAAPGDVPSRDRPKYFQGPAIDVTLDMESNQLPGAEVCWILLTCREGNAETVAPREMYRIMPGSAERLPQETTRQVTLRNMTTELELTWDDEGRLLLEGRIDGIGDKRFAGQVRFELRRATDPDGK